MILIICIVDKTCHYDKEESSDIKEIADITDVSAVTVKILIYKAENDALIINISAEDTSVIFSSLSTLFSNDVFHFF